MRELRSLKILFVGFVLYCSNVFSQNCPLCVIDLTCDSVPTAPKLCPSALPTDTAQQYYEADVTFYIPKTFDIDSPVSTTLDLNRIDVVGLSGMPAGLSWTSYDYTGNDTTSFYPPSNPPSSERGCAKICGIPLLPGNYTITVSVLAYIYVYANGQNMTQPQSFDVPLTILPSTTGNSVYTMTNSQGCDSITTSFAPILQSGGNPLYAYTWDFGDSNGSVDEFPSHAYNTPGYYVASLTMDIYQYVVTDVNVTNSGCGWSGDVEELFCFSNTPDLYFIINDGTSVITAGTVDGTKTPSWDSINGVITGNQFTIEFWDEDVVSQNDDLGSATVNFPGAGTYNFTTSGDVTGTVTIAVELDTTYFDTDTVFVYGSPVLNSIIVSPNDSVCNGDSIILTITGGEFYQWYEDTNLIPGAIDSFYITYQSGNYWVEVTNSFGCSANSGQTTVSMIPNPLVPTFFFAGNNTLQTFSAGPNLQWHLNGNPIPGANQQTLQITASGNYHLTATNYFGCVSSSNTLYVTYTCPAGPVSATSSSVCDGDSITLTISGGESYQWYEDTNLISGAIDSFYVAYQSGDYWVEVTNSYGCTANSAQKPITVAPYPPAPTFSLVGNNTLQTFSTGPILQWYLNGNPIPGGNQQTLQITASGNFHLTASNAFGCVSSSDTMFFNYVGIDEAESTLNSLRIYPNPNNGQFNLSFTTFKKQNIIISISDIFGRTVYDNELVDIQGLYSTTFNMEKLTPGLYFFKINIGSGSFNKKLLIQY